MLKENEVIELLKNALKKYILNIENSSAYYIEYEGEINAYLNVLNREELEIKYLDMSKAKELLKRI
ncbi:hypothetical protein [uncultured Clostridium sp.]|mgnify:CR=1 FL=1|uniref:hypothetical protein n=1 Tax=uncultured Clostridium sp. TaxID=59620 RepID=UPI0025ECCB20|nr:hypothetical protein [uncultured Clostridium sp.]